MAFIAVHSHRFFVCWMARRTGVKPSSQESRIAALQQVMSALLKPRPNTNESSQGGSRKEGK